MNAPTEIIYGANLTGCASDLLALDCKQKGEKEIFVIQLEEKGVGWG